METERIAVSQRERDRLRALHEAKHRQITQVEAARRLQISEVKHNRHDNGTRSAPQLIHLVLHETASPVNVPALSEQGNKNLFVFTTGWDYLEPANIRGRSGILSHNTAYSNHSDGSFLALYTWLRIEKGFDSTKSYRLTKSLMESHSSKPH